MLFKHSDYVAPYIHRNELLRTCVLAGGFGAGFIALLLWCYGWL